MIEGRGSSSSFSRGVAWMTMGNWSEQAVNLLVFTLLLRLLPAESFGLLSMAMALVLIGEGLVRETLSEYVFSARDPDPDDLNTSFWSLVVLGLALTLVLWCWLRFWHGSTMRRWWRRCSGSRRRSSS